MENFNIAKLERHCYRGMLELDLLLLPFVRQLLQQPNIIKREFSQLLELSDPQLFDILIAKQYSSSHPQFATIEAILA